jgi:hypothetical protein
MSTRPIKKGRALFQHPLHGLHGAQRENRVTLTGMNMVVAIRFELSRSAVAHFTMSLDLPT